MNGDKYQGFFLDKKVSEFPHTENDLPAAVSSCKSGIAAQVFYCSYHGCRSAQRKHGHR